MRSSEVLLPEGRRPSDCEPLCFVRPTEAQPEKSVCLPSSEFKKTKQNRGPRFPSYAAPTLYDEVGVG